jgi:hypothetical protein
MHNPDQFFTVTPASTAAPRMIKCFGGDTWIGNGPSSPFVVRTGQQRHGFKGYVPRVRDANLDAAEDGGGVQDSFIAIDIGVDEINFDSTHDRGEPAALELLGSDVALHAAEDGDGVQV